MVAIGAPVGPRRGPAELPTGNLGPVTEVQRREVVVHGHRIAYRQCGPIEPGAPVLLLVHGLAGSAAGWSDVLEPLAAVATVVAPDLPGHGDSDKPRQDYSLAGHANALRDLMVVLGIDRATVVGHSLGGGVAMQLAYQHPDRCERLVLVSSGGLGPDVSWALRLLSLPGAELALPAIAPRFVRDAGDAVGRAAGRLGLRWPLLEQSWQSYASLAEAENRRSFLQTLRGVVGPSGQVLSAQDRLYLAAHLPTLLVWGGSDRMIPVEHGRAAHESLPGSELVVFERAGHFPHNEEPEAFARAVTDFLDRTQPATWDAAGWSAALRAGPAPT
jgi:pimeloyl-ACP methyl ester carboxylesterase